jgi:hypothetical protein
MQRSVADPDPFDEDRILLFTLIPIWVLLFSLIRIRIQMFDTDPDPYRFKEVMYLKHTFYTSLLDFPTGPKQKAHFVKFSLPVNFVVLIIVAYGSESGS